MNLLKRKPSEILKTWRWWEPKQYGWGTHEFYPGIADLAVQAYGKETAENVMKYFLTNCFKDEEIDLKSLPQEIQNTSRYALAKGIEKMLCALGHEDSVKKIMPQLGLHNTKISF